MRDNVDRVRQLYESAARRDFAVWRELLHEGVEWHAANRATYFGPDAVVEALSGCVQALDGFAIDVRRIIAAGETVVVEARYRAVGRGTGRVLDAPVAYVFDLHEGKIVRVQQYTDSWHLTEDVTRSPGAAAPLITGLGARGPALESE